MACVACCGVVQYCVARVQEMGAGGESNSRRNMKKRGEKKGKKKEKEEEEEEEDAKQHTGYRLPVRCWSGNQRLFRSHVDVKVVIHQVQLKHQAHLALFIFIVSHRVDLKGP